MFLKDHSGVKNQRVVADGEAYVIPHTGPVPGVKPKVLAKGSVWDESTITEEDLDYKAKCRCVSHDLSKGISMCNTGCGDPTTTCSSAFGCARNERSCNADKCACKPFAYEGIETNFMTYQMCYDQCAAIGMELPYNKEGIEAASNTGGGTNGKRIWLLTEGAI